MDAKQTFARKVAYNVKLGGLEKCAPLSEVCHLVPRCHGSQDEEIQASGMKKGAGSALNRGAGLTSTQR